MPKNSLIDLLLAYGPCPDGNAMYDEFVQAEAAKSGLAPLQIQECVSDGVVADLRSGAPLSIILTGTAGDGKTFTARRVFERIASSSWNSAKTANVATLADGRSVTFLKDLSELSRTEGDFWFPRLADALLGPSNELFVVCVNDGQLLSFFRERQHDPRAKALLLEMTRMLQGERERPSDDGPFRLLHMSRKSHARTIDAIFKEILDHPGWSACPEDCPAQIDGALCPIRRNRAILNAEDGIFRKRVRNAVEIAAADDRHLALRQLIILVVNALLGEADSRQTPLMTCRRAQAVLEDDAFERTNPFSNVLGFNHPEAMRQGISVFDTLSRLGIGEETTNAFDDALLDDTASTALPNDDTYGIPIFAATRAEYAEHPSENAVSIREAMKTQRRRLFFTMPGEPGEGLGNAWHLTRFHSGQDYLDLVQELAAGQAPGAATIRRISLGLNRTLTGLLTDSADDIWLTRPSGDVHGGSVPLLVDAQIPWTGRHTKAVLVPPSAQGRPPALEIQDGDARFGRLALTPTMFEFLARVSAGALPGSFGSQCLQDIRTFQITTVGAIEQATKANDQSMRLQAISLREQDGALEARPIRLMEVVQ